MLLHVSSTMCSSSGVQNLYYTVSGIVIPVGGRPVHRFGEDSLNLCTEWPFTECNDNKYSIIQF